MKSDGVPTSERERIKAPSGKIWGRFRYIIVSSALMTA